MYTDIASNKYIDYAISFNLMSSYNSDDIKTEKQAYFAIDEFLSKKLNGLSVVLKELSKSKLK
jgi:hypothetical protein